MGTIDLGDIRVKEVDDLTDEDTKALSENWDELNEEEQEAFKGHVDVPEDKPEEEEVEPVAEMEEDSEPEEDVDKSFSF